MMEIETNQDISLLDEVKLQARVLVPLVRSLRKELGEEKTNRLVSKALREWSEELYRRVGAQTPGTPRQKWESIVGASLPRIGNDIDIEWLERDPERLEFNVTGCRYADFFRALDEPELGGLLLCNSDVYSAQVGAPDVEFTRTQTIMQGAKYCDFRYRIKRT